MKSGIIKALNGNVSIIRKRYAGTRQRKALHRYLSSLPNVTAIQYQVKLEAMSIAKNGKTNRKISLKFTE